MPEGDGADVGACTARPYAAPPIASMETSGGRGVGWGRGPPKAQRFRGRSGLRAGARHPMRRGASGPPEGPGAGGAGRATGQGAGGRRGPSRGREGPWIGGAPGGTVGRSPKKCRLRFLDHPGIFGSDDHKTALLGFLNDILQLDETHRIASVALLPPEQRPKVSELKNSIVDVKCVDARGATYVVEMQVFNVEAFEKRVMYNVAKAYTNQLGVGFAYPELDDVVGITICDFELWPRKETPHVPMLSRWRMQEQESGVTGLPHLQFVFLELPKYAAGHDPETSVDKWAYFFREAGTLMAIPEALRHPPLLDALEGARTARFNRQEWDAYIAASMAIQNERGALSLARREGRDEGEVAAQARAVLTVLRVRGIAVPDAARERILAEKAPARLERWLEKAAVAASVAEVIDDPT
jgi:predicted transposase/invertase (TIGR01784 family)